MFSNFILITNAIPESQKICQEHKRSQKICQEHKRYVRNCDCDKNEIAKHCWEADHNLNWDQKKVVDRESRLIPRKIKETIHSLKNPNHINKISYMLPEI